MVGTGQTARGTANSGTFKRQVPSSFKGEFQESLKLNSVGVVFGQEPRI